MKSIWLIAGLFLMMLPQGCYWEAPLAQRPVPDIEVVRADSPPPSPDKADLIIYSHIKKRFFAKPGAEEKPYTFFISIDGRELKETVKGIKETTSDILEERGEGIRYELAIRLRLDQGVHEVTLRTEDGISAKAEIELEVAKVYALRFEPVYRSFTRKFGFPRSFRYGISGFTVFTDGKRVWKVYCNIANKGREHVLKGGFPMSMEWTYGPHHWLWMIIWVGFWALVVAGLVLVIRSFLTERRAPLEKKAIDYLNERYAKGEMSREEYLQKREDIHKGGA